MIKKIKTISKIAKFNEFEQDIEFGKINLIFGANGSGKTTISNIFNLFSTNKIFTEEEKKDLFDNIKNGDKAKVDILYNEKEELSYPTTENQNNKKQALDKAYL